MPVGGMYTALQFAMAKEEGEGEVLNFQPNPNDHAETSLDACRDIAPLLAAVAEVKRKSWESLRIYDPYFCAGTIKGHLASLGFPNVYNENEDFYLAVERGTVPKHDCLVTNPPYTDDTHIRRLVDFVTKRRKFALVLMPSWVYMKPFFQERKRPGGWAFLAPEKRYRYFAPSGWRKRGKRTAPFNSLWYVFCKSRGKRNRVMARWQQVMSADPTALPSRIAEVARRARGSVLCDCTNDLPKHALDTFDPAYKRIRNAEKSLKRRRLKA